MWNTFIFLGMHDTLLLFNERGETLVDDATVLVGTSRHIQQLGSAFLVLLGAKVAYYALEWKDKHRGELLSGTLLTLLVVVLQPLYILFGTSVMIG